MDESLSELLDLSIAHEINISRLYTLFHELFEEDEDFWWQLSIEERSHAALLRNEKKLNRPSSGALPENLLSSDLEALTSSNTRIESLIEEYTANPPTRGEALQAAHDLEQSVGEIHYQEFMTRKSCSLSDELFKQLNMEDKDHADRIQSYMQANGFSLQERH